MAKQLASKDPYLSFTYFASSHGALRFFPGTAWARNASGGAVDYDPRGRPWYSGSITGHRVVSILLDIPSATESDRIVSAARSILTTLRDGDYFAVFQTDDSEHGLSPLFTGNHCVPLDGQLRDSNWSLPYFLPATYAEAVGNQLQALATPTLKLKSLRISLPKILDQLYAFKAQTPVPFSQVAAILTGNGTSRRLFESSRASDPTSQDFYSFITKINFKSSHIFAVANPQSAEYRLLERLACSNYGSMFNLTNATQIPTTVDYVLQMARADIQSPVISYGRGLKGEITGRTEVNAANSSFFSLSSPILTQQTREFIGVAGIDFGVQQVASVLSKFVSSDRYPFIITPAGTVPFKSNEKRNSLWTSLTFGRPLDAARQGLVSPQAPAKPVSQRDLYLGGGERPGIPERGATYGSQFHQRFRHHFDREDCVQLVDDEILRIAFRDMLPDCRPIYAYQPNHASRRRWAFFCADNI